jgi:cytoskeletal protein CcmA (bactofilin family)
MAEDASPAPVPEDPADSLEGESLDAAATLPETAENATASYSAPSSDKSPDPPKPVSKKRLPEIKRHFNIYLLLFILILLLALIIFVIAFLQGHQTKTNHFQTQTLTQKTLDQLANSDVTVGSNQSVLNVQSSAVFAGQVLVRQNLQVAGNLQIGGTTALNNLTVNGTSQFGQVNITKNLAVSGESAVQGGQTVTKSLQVNGGGSFGGPLSAPQITTSALQLNGELVLTHHITAGGATPGHSNGSALGSGGSASLSGSDTAGAISINTGGSPAAGCLITVNFSAHYNAMPHVLVTPVGSAAGGLSYYVNRSSTSFSLCDATAPPAGSSFGFDYFVID